MCSATPPRLSSDYGGGAENLFRVQYGTTILDNRTICVISSAYKSAGIRPWSSRTFSLPVTMSFNGTQLLTYDGWQGYVAQYQEHLPSRGRLALLAVINLPVLIVLLHALWQVVSAVSIENATYRTDVNCSVGQAERSFSTSRSFPLVTICRIRNLIRQ